jgi:hypothetical protein
MCNPYTCIYRLLMATSVDSVNKVCSSGTLDSFYCVGGHPIAEYAHPVLKAFDEPECIM